MCAPPPLLSSMHVHGQHHSSTRAAVLWRIEDKGQRYFITHTHKHTRTRTRSHTHTDTETQRDTQIHTHTRTCLALETLQLLHPDMASFTHPKKITGCNDDVQRLDYWHEYSSSSSTAKIGIELLFCKEQNELGARGKSQKRTTHQAEAQQESASSFRAFAFARNKTNSVHKANRKAYYTRRQAAAQQQSVSSFHLDMDKRTRCTRQTAKRTGNTGMDIYFGMIALALGVWAMG